MVEGNNGGLVSLEESTCGEEVGVCDVLDVREVVEVIIGTQLESVLARFVYIQCRGSDLLVSFAENTTGSDSAGEKIGRGLAVGGEDKLFSFSL